MKTIQFLLKKQTQKSVRSGHGTPVLDFYWSDYLPMLLIAT